MQQPKAKGRPATGGLEFIDGQWVARITLADKSRPRVKLDPERFGPNDRERAVAFTRTLARVAKETGAIPTSTAETLSEYSERWLASREVRGLTSVGDDRGRLRKHVLPILGAYALNAITKAQLEDLVLALDKKVRESTARPGTNHAFSSKTARHVWSLVSKMFDDATRAKDRSLRVLETNTALGVRAPDDGGERASQFLWPSEWLALWNADDDVVPLRRRCLYAILVYTGMRSGELGALLWSDVDLEHRTISITKAVEERKNKVGPTKTEETRTIAIEPALLPVLRYLKAKGAKGKLGDFWMPPVENRAALFRADLIKAGVTRDALHNGTATSRNITIHDLRASCLTWMAVRGDAPLAIQEHAGHTTFKTTERYVRAARAVGKHFGEVFPSLDRSVFPQENHGVQVEPVQPTFSASRPKLEPQPIVFAGQITTGAGCAPVLNVPETPVKEAVCEGDTASGSIVDERSPSSADAMTNEVEPSAAVSSSEPAPAVSADDALRAAAKAAIDAGMFDRAAALLALLRAG